MTGLAYSTKSSIRTGHAPKEKSSNSEINISFESLPAAIVFSANKMYLKHNPHCELYKH